MAICRFVAEEEALQLLARCLEPERSEAVKLCGITACIVLIRDVRVRNSFGLAADRLSS